MDINDEMLKLRQELREFHVEREREADNLLISFSRLPYSGLITVGVFLALITVGFIAARMIYGTFFCV